MSLESTELEALLLGTLRDTPLLVVVFGRDGSVAWVNAAVEQSLEVAREELQGHASEVLLRGALPTLEGLTERVEGDFELVRADGGTAWVRGRMSRVRDGAGRRLGTALVASTTAGGTHWHHTLLRGALPSAMGMIGAEVAHEVNNPSTWLRLNIDQLKSDLDELGTVDPALAVELLEECQEGLDRISAIAGELRALAAPELQELAQTDLREVVAAACSLAPLLPTGRVLVRRELAEVPRLQLAAGRVGQAVWSLLSLCVREVSQTDDHPALGVRLHDDGVNIYLDMEVGSPLRLDPEVCLPSARSQGPPELRMARTVLAAHGGLVMSVPQGNGLRVQLPIVPSDNPLL